MKRFLHELKRREVIKPVAAYIGLSWLVLQVVGVVGDLMPIPALVGSGVLLFLLCGLPVIAYLGWHFDFSFEGIARTATLTDDEHEAVEPFGFFNWVAVVLLVSVSAFVGLQSFASLRSQQLAQDEGLTTIQEASSLAVLPFVDQSPEQDQAYLAVGLAEEITSLLGRADGFRITASRSSQILAETGLPPTDIGRRLGVDVVLTGSVRAVGSRLKIRVELLSTDDGRALWTENFLRELKDVFEIEAQISRAVVNLLQDEYLEAGEFAAVATTKSTDAYVMYLKGREAYRQQTTESMREARELFEQAIALDPEYAKAYVALADAIASLAEGPDRFGVLKPKIAAALAEENLNKAILREPDLADIYAVLGIVNLLRNNFDESLGNFDKAIDLNPSYALAYMWKSLALNELQRFDEAIETVKVARDLDPLFQTSAYNLGLWLSRRGRTEEAVTLFRQMETDFPDSPFPFLGLKDIYFGQGDFVNAIRYGQKAVALSPGNDDLIQQLVGPMLQLRMTDAVRKNASDPAWSAAIDTFYESILIFEGSYEELFSRMDFKVEANPNDYWTAFEAGWYAAMFGDEDKAIEFLLRDSSALAVTEFFAVPYCSPALEIAWARSKMQDQDAAAELISACERVVLEQRSSSIVNFEVDYLEARIYALQGNDDGAMRALQNAIAKGWREWWTEHDPLLSTLRGRQDYQASMQRIRDDLARQRSEAEALLAQK